MRTGSKEARPETGLPPSDGSILSDVGVQDFWETSAGQQPTEAEAGILTVFLGGNAADPTKTDEKSVLAAFHEGLRQIWPKMAESLDMAAVTSMFWSNYRFTLGSYYGAKVGQYTTMLDEAAKPALDEPPAICRRAYERRKAFRLYEWRRAKWKPRCPRARQTHGALYNRRKRCVIHVIDFIVPPPPRVRRARLVVLFAEPAHLTSARHQAEVTTLAHGGTLLYSLISDVGVS